MGIGEQRRRVEIGFRRKHLITRSFDTEKKKQRRSKLRTEIGDRRKRVRSDVITFEKMRRRKKG